jgi:hypothetical protein
MGHEKRFQLNCDANIRIVPCASVLVRLTRVPKGSTGKALEVR